MTQNITLKSILSGNQALYKQPDYLGTTAKDLSSTKALPKTV